MAKFSEVPSPFCGIGIDDLDVEVDGSKVSITANACAVTSAGFEQPIGSAEAKISGQSVSLEQAVNKAAELLSSAKQPFIGGCATDVNGMRALLAVADKSGAVVDNMKFNATRNNFLAMQDSGWMNTTLSEIKNRCDFLLVVGVDLESFAPRFFERYLWNEEPLYLTENTARKIVYLGAAPSGKAATSPSGQQPDVFACANENVPDVVAALSALVKGKTLAVEHVGGIAVSTLAEIAKQLQEAKYSVVTWSSSTLDYSHAELTVQTLCNIVKEINNQDARCSGFPLGGKEGDYTSNQVCGWITGYPARVNFNKGYPEYDPFLFDSQIMLNDGQADALLWVHSYNVDATPPETDIPTIVVGRSGMTFDSVPDVFIPVGVPGIDHAGHSYRLDSVVALRLKKLRDAGLPSTADVLQAIEQAL